MTDQELVNNLCRSYEQQLIWYTQLQQIMQKMLNGVILSGGDISGVLPPLQEKQTILERITAQHHECAPYETAWQQRKKQLPQADVDRVMALLSRLSAVIKDFLDGEEQLKTYIARFQQSVS
ncbi:MAG: hypothetical protein PHC61_13325 [Chitinivibrionales bacterium]|nr:hypothetical protein [Chitinivibrionales bacterium]